MRIDIRPVARCSLIFALLALLTSGWPVAPALGEVPSTRETTSDVPSTGPATPGTRRWDPDMFLSRARALLDDLHFTDEQKTKVDQLFADAAKDLKRMQGEWEALQPGERVARGQEYMATLRSKVAALLTDEQRKALREKLVTAGQGPGGAMMGHFREVLSKLDLTDEQQQKVDDALAESRAKFDAARTAAHGDTAAMHQSMLQMSSDLRAKLKDILTDEQRQKLRELMPRLAAESATTEPTTKE